MCELSGATILLVDDERYITTTIAGRLNKAGAKTTIANNGQEALAIACELRPTVILSDYQMPLMGGLELCTRLKADERTAEIPVIMLTAKGFRIPPSDLMNTNIRVLLAKPFSVKEVMAELEKLLQEINFTPASQLTPTADHSTHP